MVGLTLALELGIRTTLRIYLTRRQVATQSKSKEPSLGTFALDCVRPVAALRISDALNDVRLIFHTRADNQRTD
jgi:hypothetical protein